MKTFLPNFKKLQSQLLAVITALFLVALLPSYVMADDMSDTMITAKVKSGLVANNLTHATNISVATNNGVVSLSGEAQSDTEATTAVEVAQSVDGVTDVDTSNLTVRGSSQPLTDAYITAKVKGIFIKSNLTSDGSDIPWSKIKVETKDGVVYLKGKVKHSAQVDQVVQLTKSVNGVTKVVSQLKVG